MRSLPVRYSVTSCRNLNGGPLTAVLLAVLACLPAQTSVAQGASPPLAQTEIGQIQAAEAAQRKAARVKAAQAKAAQIKFDQAHPPSAIAAQAKTGQPGMTAATKENAAALLRRRRSAAQAAAGGVAASAQADPGTSTAFSQAVGAGGPVAMVVGRSMFINTSARLQRVYVSNPAVLDSYTASPRQIVITAKGSGASSLVLWDETGRSEAYLVVSSVDVASLREAVGKAFPGQQIAVAAEQDDITLTGRVRDQATIDAAVKMAGAYGKNVINALLLAPPHLSQVRLKVRIIEIDRSKEDQFGLNFFAGGSNPGGATTGQFPVSTSTTSGTATGTTGLTVSDPLNLFYFNKSLNVGVTIKDLESRRIVQILAEPTITTISGEKGSFLSGGEFPFPVVQGGAVVTVSIEFRPYGVKLDFTPTVNPDGTILLKVAPEVSALDYTNAVNISGYTIPALSTRRAETTVELRDGQSFAISGLLDNRTTDILNKVPVAGNLPIIGALFRSKDIIRSVVELVVVVTPTIVDPLSTNPGGIDPGDPENWKFVIPLLDDQQFDQQIKTAVKPFPAVSPPPR